MRTLLPLLLLAAVPAALPAQTPTATPAPATADARLTAFLDRAWEEQVALSPETQTGLGRKTDYDRLDDYTDAADIRRRDLAERQLKAMRAGFDPARLGPSARLSFRLFERQVERGRDGFRWRKYAFPASTNGSPMGDVPVFLINEHQVDGVADAEAYVARLRDAGRVMRETAALMREQAQAGIVPPRLNFAPVRADGRKVLTGAPFTAGPDSALMADFRKKVAALSAPPAEKDRLLAAAAAALTGPFKRGYDVMFAALDAIEPLAKGDNGAWALPDGAAYYANRLRNATTTDLTADQIHQLGLQRVTAIRAEMEAVKARVGFTGTLEQFFTQVRTDPRFKYPNTDAGRQEYLADARAVIAAMMAAAPRFFAVLPRAPLEVRAVEKWREGTASTAFYNRPSLDGKRPGIFYVNLADMTQTQKVQLTGIAVHEGAPGHHFQIARAMELTGLPRFRTTGFGLHRGLGALHRAAGEGDGRL